VLRLPGGFADECVDLVRELLPAALRFPPLSLG